MILNKIGRTFSNWENFLKLKEVLRNWENFFWLLSIFGNFSHFYKNLSPICKKFSQFLKKFLKLKKFLQIGRSFSKLREVLPNWEKFFKIERSFSKLREVLSVKVLNVELQTVRARVFFRKGAGADLKNLLPWLRLWKSLFFVRFL